MRTVGIEVRGVRAPIIREGNDLAAIVVDSLLAAQEEKQFTFHDRDIVAITESVVARSQGNYATIDDIAYDVREQFGDTKVGIIFPILSRNRFAICLKGMARGLKKMVIMLSYPSDEVGNQLMIIDDMDAKGVNPYSDVLTEEKYRELFGYELHPFTGVDYINYYKEVAHSEGCEVEIVLANDPKAILKYTKNIINCDIHSRFRTRRILMAAGAEKVIGMDQIMLKPVSGKGYNDKYGLLGSNKATEESIKLFPRDCQPFVEDVQARLKEATGCTIEVMVYGDGAFKDPVGKIWELADPVVSPGYTKGLQGKPNEVKLKYLADNDFKNLKGEELKSAISDYIKHKDDDLVGQMASQGTTPRQLTDLIGSLCDLSSGSGDKGTPIVFIQGYFDNYAID